MRPQTAVSTREHSMLAAAKGAWVCEALSVALIVLPGHVLLPCSKFHMVDRARLRQHVGKELHPTKTCDYPRVANLHAPDGQLCQGGWSITIPSRHDLSRKN